MKFALLTVSAVDLVPLKPDHDKLFEFPVDQYYRRLVAGYSKSRSNKGLLGYMADDREMQPLSQATKK